MRIRLIPACCVLLVATVDAGCGTGDGARRFAVTGLVVAAPEGATLHVAHDDIPGFMPAMTMPFLAMSPADIDGIAPGDRVSFTLRVGERTTIEGIRVTGKDPIGLRRITSGGAVGSARLRDGDRVRPLRLVDQTGRPFTEADLSGVVTVATFIFTRCPLPDYCPAMMTRLKHLLTRTASEASLRDRVRALAITLDPAFDTPEILAAYAEAHGVADAPFTLVTGDAGELEALTAAFAVVARPSAVGIDHSLATAIIGPDGSVRTVLRGNDWTVEQALDVVRQAAGR